MSLYVYRGTDRDVGTDLDVLIARAAPGAKKEPVFREPGLPGACGTISGYERHRRDGERTCQLCRAERSQYEAARRRAGLRA